MPYRPHHFIRASYLSSSPRAPCRDNESLQAKEPANGHSTPFLVVLSKWSGMKMWAQYREREQQTPAHDPPWPDCCQPTGLGSGGVQPLSGPPPSFDNQDKLLARIHARRLDPSRGAISHHPHGLAGIGPGHSLGLKSLASTNTECAFCLLHLYDTLDDLVAANHGTLPQHTRLRIQTRCGSHHCTRPIPEPIKTETSTTTPYGLHKLQPVVAKTEPA